VEYTEQLGARGDAAGPEVPTTSDEALRLAVKLAIDAGEYDRAAAVVDLLRRTSARGTVTSIAATRERS
jgi:hypothetical protein